jgi:hypothetical protein
MSPLRIMDCRFEAGNDNIGGQRPLRIEELP